ncbi:uncharacterized protein B0H64DRAFT_399768 [Chaetomium fimeti]|uniref:Uncharacterized protein n=1 Tax=Chaetomium fimeti TaxID=1854472 RepID=A0AAE0HCZ7_9PEZI|nr:hypothetical protein B0H64DRAFT_399768 [Chaetomium fimeti]
MATIRQSRGIMRGIVIISLPLALTIYFLVIWRLYLVPDNDNGNGLVFGRSGANAIYYSWFVLASVGLSIFHYGREGVAERMLIRPKSLALDSKHQDDHIPPNGWLLAFGRPVLLRREPATRGLTSLAWTLLSLVTLFGYVGLPLSGLTMEFETGYQFLSGAPAGGTDRHPTVMGYNKENWNARFTFDTTERAFSRWSETTRIQPPPGDGVIYTSQEVDRSSLADSGVFTNLPNSLPRDTGVSNVFLAPQSDTGAPIDGKSWGLAFSYECSVVTKLSDFTILSHRKEDAELASGDAYGYDVLGPNATIEIYNQTSSGATARFANNLQAVAEVGYNWPYRQRRQTTNLPVSSECYNPISIPGPESKTMPYPGMDDEPQVLELILWQNLSAKNTNPNIIENPPTLNFTLPDTIPELFGAYQTQADAYNITPPTPMAAIGVRCTSTSAVGTAHLDGRRAAFHTFQPSNSTPVGFASSTKCAERLSIGVPHLLFSGTARDRAETEWLSHLYASAGRFAQGYAQLGTHFIGTRVPLQSAYLQAEELRGSLTRAYGLYVMQLVYNGGVGYVDGEGRYREASEFVNGEAVVYSRGTVLVPGIVPPVVAFVFLALWAVGSGCFGVLYLFRGCRGLVDH